MVFAVVVEVGQSSPTSGSIPANVREGSAEPFIETLLDRASVKLILRTDGGQSDAVARISISGDHSLTGSVTVARRLVQHLGTLL